MIRGAVREAGDRAKVAVFSRERDVDPVGACVGMRGTRVQAIIRELRGEKIDIVEWSEDPVTFVTKALSPARVQRVSIVDDEQRVMEVVVEDRQLSLAIGKKGQNVRLAAKLTGWKIDIKSDEEKRKEVELQLEGIDFGERRRSRARADAARHSRRSRGGAARRRVRHGREGPGAPRPNSCWRCRASIRTRWMRSSRRPRSRTGARTRRRPKPQPTRRKPPPKSPRPTSGTRRPTAATTESTLRSQLGHCPDLQGRRIAGPLEPGGDESAQEGNGHRRQERVELD